MNVTIIRGKDLLKYLVEIAIALAVIAFTTSFFKSEKRETRESKLQEVSEKIAESVDSEFLTKIFEYTLPILQKNENDEIPKKNIQEQILEVNFGMASNLKENIEDETKETESVGGSIARPQENDNTEKNEKLEFASTEVTTSQVEENNIPISYTDELQGIQIKNQSSYQITEEFYSEDYDFTNSKNVLIFHTHTCESYTPTEKYNYEMTGSYRTTDLDYSVARVGDELDKYLTEYGFNVMHDTTYHDYPAYNGSYGRSEETVKNILNENPNIKTIIDLHRDAVGASNEYAPSVLIGEEKAAQIMLVIGTDGGGLYNPNWRENFKLAVMLQKKADELYPGLFRPLILRDSRYNHHLSTGAMLIEVGATGNTLEECLASMKYLSKIMSEVIK